MTNVLGMTLWGSVFADGVPWSRPCVTAGTFRICSRREITFAKNRRNFRFFFGVPHALQHASVAAMARGSRLLGIAQEILGSKAFPFRATLFDKSPKANWLVVVWHQDTALPLRDRRELPGWGPWSVKEGVNYAHAPASAFCRVLALCVHLDH